MIFSSLLLCLVKLCCGCVLTTIFLLGSESPEVAQTGPLIAPAALPILRAEQQQALQMAKRYCHDITAKFVSPPVARVHDIQRGKSMEQSYTKLRTCVESRVICDL